MPKYDSNAWENLAVVLEADVPEVKKKNIWKMLYHSSKENKEKLKMQKVWG